MEDASGTDRGRYGEGSRMSLQSPFVGYREGEFGRNELIRGPLALFEVRSGARLEKTSPSTRGLPCPLHN